MRNTRSWLRVAGSLAAASGLAVSAYGVAVDGVVAEGAAMPMEVPSLSDEDPAGGVPAGSSIDPNGATDFADKEGVARASLERARMDWPFRVTREEVEARMADDSAERIMLARLAARNIPFGPAHLPNWYVYRGQRIAMELDTTRIAVMLVEGVGEQAMEAVATGAARAGGAVVKHDGHERTGRWVLVKLDRPLAGLEQCNEVLNAAGVQPGVGLASPVFHSPLVAGGYITITPDVLVRVKPHLEGAKQQVVAAKAPNLSVFNADFGPMSGAMHLRSSARNGFDVLAEANRLSADPAFAWAEPDLRGTVDFFWTPDDPDYPSQWHHNNDGSSGGVVDADMDSDLAWNYTRGSSVIETLIMDNGTQSNHPDINWVNGRDFTTGVVGGVLTGDPSVACDNHGTPVAGIVAQHDNNNLLGSGTCPNSQVLGAKCADSSISNPPCSNAWSGQSSYFVNALNWGVSQGADLSNGSFGWTPNSAMTDAYEATAITNGMLHMAACGNGGTFNGVAYPASAPYVYGIVNLQRNNTRNPSSDYGAGVDFSAPGTTILTTDRTGSAGYTTGDNTNFGGTSAASPNAAGVGAMFRSAYLWATRSQTYAGIADGCREMGPSGFDTEFGYGFVNSYYQIVDVDPSNNRCVNATIIPSGTTNYNPAVYSTTWATDDWLDPQASCELNGNGEGAAVYYRFTAANTGTLNINTNGSSYDTVLSVWNGCGSISPNTNNYLSPTQIACDDDGGTSTQSQILNLPINIGDTYYIKVSAYNNTSAGGTLDFNLTFTPTPPPNDSCSSRTVIPGAAYGTYDPPILDTDNATVATCENQESCEAGNVGVSNSVWYEFTPFEDGVITIDTEGSDYDTVVSIFSGACAFLLNGNCIGWSQLACDDDSGTGTLSLISNFEVDQGVTYYIKVADYNTSDGGGALDFNLVFSPPPVPSNNECNNATVIPGGEGNYLPPILRTHSAGGSLCGNPETCVTTSSHNVWYSFTPTCNGLFGVNTAGSDYDTVLSIWSRCGFLRLNPTACSYGTQFACDDDGGPGLTSMINNFPVTAGTNYIIKVAAFGSTDGGRLDFNTQFVCTGLVCDSIDFNNDGLYPDTTDVEDFVRVFQGSSCSTNNCNDIDFNNDGLFPDTTDLQALLSVFAGGPCL